MGNVAWQRVEPTCYANARASHSVASRQAVQPRLSPCLLAFHFCYLRLLRLLLHRSPGSDLAISAASTTGLSLRAKPQPVPANLSATFRVASIAVPASAATLRYVASTKGTQQMSSRKLTRSIIVGAAAIAVAGGSYGIVSATSSSSPAAASSSPAAASSGSAGGLGSGGGGSNARSGPAAGGSSGTVGSLSTSSFTMTTSAGQKVTVKEASSTTYQNGTSPTSASAITTGEPVLVLGTTSGTIITATQVIVQPTGGGSATSSAAQVVPFQRGAPSTSKTVGQIPADYSQGSGTIVSGTAANKATEAALAAYPGGVVDRVVQLSNGEYEVHYIGVNWPHHIFVNQDFKVIGAND